MNENISRVTVGDIQTNCWIYPYDDESSDYKSADQKSCAIMDPGDEAGKIISRLEKIKHIPRYIFLTHGHFDHLAAIPDLMAAFSKSGLPVLPKIGIHILDAHYLGKDAHKYHRESYTATGGHPAYIDSLVKPLPDADMLLEEGIEAGPFKVLHLPGHTKGSVAFYDTQAGVLFSGDTLFRNGQGRTDLPGGDENEIRKSLKRLFSMNGDIAVYPGHGAVTTIGEEAGR